MDKDTPNITSDTSCCGSTMENVMKNIYTSCDPHNLNMVPTSEIIEFIRPYMLEDLSALETLRNMLDPENKNVFVASEKFFNVMNEWTQKIASHTEEEGEGDFNRTPSQLHVLDEKLLPYTQSTPRPSFGQKLLNCEGLLNLSNVSSYNLSPTKQAKDISISVPERTILEEEVKQLQYQLNKVLGEIEMLRVQLAFSEDQNEALQEQLEKCKTRSQSGQPVNENVQDNKTCMDELREEIVLGKKRIEELNKKLTFYEKDNMQLNQYAQKLEKENVELEEHFAKTKQNLENEIFGLRTELEIKDHEISTVSKINEELRLKLCEKMTELEQVLTENEVLDYKQQDLEKLLSSKRYSLSSHYNSCLDEMSSFLARDQADGGDESQPAIPNVGPYESLQTELFQVDPQFDHKDKNGIECDYEDQILSLKTENECLQKKMEEIEKENKVLSVESNNVQDKAKELERKLSNLMLEKEEIKTETTKQLEEDISKLKSILDDKEQKICQLEEKFDFEPVYKNLEVEFGKKVTLIDQLQKKIKLLQLQCNETKEINNKNENNEDWKKDLQEKNTRIKQLQDVIRKESDVKNEVWKENEDLRKQLKGVEKEKVEIMEKLGDSEDFGKKLQERLTEIGIKCDELELKLEKEIEENSKFQTQLSLNENLKKDLQEKSTRIEQLQNVIRKESDVKNEVWKENEDLRKQLEGVEKEKIEIMQKLEDSEDFGKKLQECLIEIRLKCDALELKLKEEVEKNFKFQTQLSLLKIEAEEIRENQKCYKEEIMKKLTEYEGSLQSLHCKIKYLENENNILKIDIENQRLTEDSGVRSELEDERSRKYTDGDASSESSVSFSSEKPLRSSKNRSFEKQKLTIDKLREELRQEKYKNETLKEKLILENINLKTEITELDKKLNRQEDYYKHICNAATEKINNLSEELTTSNEKNLKSLVTINEKESLLKRTYEAFEYNKNMLEQLETEVYDFKIIQNKLTTDLAGKEVLLKNLSAENQKLKLAVRCSDNKLLELSSRMFKQESELNGYRLDLDKKREEIASLSMVLSDRDGRIEALTAAATAYDIKMSDVIMELAEKEEACAKLEDEFRILNEKLVKTTDAKIKTAPPEKFDNTNLDIEMETINGHTALDTISNFTDIISECCQELNGAFTRFIDQWGNKIESHPNFNHLPYIKLCQSLNVEDVLSVIIDNIRTVIMLLDITSSKNTKTMDGDTETLLDFLTNQHNTNSVDSRNIKKFTLRPATLQLSRPTSPDSPGIEITEDEKCDSPNSRNIRKNFNKTEEGENERYTDLSILSFDLPVQDAFPHVSDTILEKLGLHEGSPKVKLTKEETEEVFTTFAIQIGLDSKDIRDRLQKQKNTCTQKYKKYQYLLKDVSKRLRDHNCIGSMDSINPVFVMLEDVRYMMQDLMQSAGQLGVLTCELRMTKCWNLVTNYMAILKQDLENTKSSTNISDPVRTKSSSPSTDVKFISNERNKVAKENKSTCCRSCLSILVCIMFVVFLVLIGAIGVHWQCKLTTEYKICLLDDFFRMITQRVGSPPY